jgi:hypothetical protein
MTTLSILLVFSLLVAFAASGIARTVEARALRRVGSARQFAASCGGHRPPCCFGAMPGGGRYGGIHRRADHSFGRSFRRALILRILYRFSFARSTLRQGWIAESARSGGCWRETDPISRIPARWPALAGTLERIEQQLRERLSMYNGACKMYNIHAGARPCRAAFCKKFPGFSGIFRELKTGFRRRPSPCHKRSGSLRLRQASPPRQSKCAFLVLIHT